MVVRVSIHLKITFVIAQTDGKEKIVTMILMNVFDLLELILDVKMEPLAEMNLVHTGVSVLPIILDFIVHKLMMTAVQLLMKHFVDMENVLMLLELSQESQDIFVCVTKDGLITKTILLVTQMSTNAIHLFLTAPLIL